ncbi:MAG: dirigent protein [Chloroflexi bacterium]|nr:dirigent protein [Chloroflexota bacterium]
MRRPHVKPFRFASLIALTALLFACSSGGTTTLHVVEHANTDTVVDIGPQGDSLGDVLAFANPVFDENNQKEVGSDNGQCIRTAVPGAWECFWTITLADGQLTVEGPFYDTKDSVLAITGGTGAYSGARGQMKLHARNAQGTEYDII